MIEQRQGHSSWGGLFIDEEDALQWLYFLEGYLERAEHSKWQDEESRCERGWHMLNGRPIKDLSRSISNSPKTAARICDWSFSFLCVSYRYSVQTIERPDSQNGAVISLCEGGEEMLSVIADDRWDSSGPMSVRFFRTRELLVAKKYGNWPCLLAAVREDMNKTLAETLASLGTTV